MRSMRRPFQRHLGPHLTSGLQPADPFAEHGMIDGSTVLRRYQGPNWQHRRSVAAVLDWEWAHPGEPIEDLASCEWIIRMRRPDAAMALEHLFAGYGQRPPWTCRQAAALAKCRSMLEIPRTGGASVTGARRWRQNIETTLSWRE